LTEGELYASSEALLKLNGNPSQQNGSEGSYELAISIQLSGKYLIFHLK
jgi:hypothetical protein